MLGSWPPSSHIRDQRDEVCAFQTESGTAHSHERFLAVIPREQRAARTALWVLAGRVESAPFSLREGLGCDMGYFQCNQSKMLQGCKHPFSWGCLGTLEPEDEDPVLWLLTFQEWWNTFTLEVRASGVITWLVAPFPFGTFPESPGFQDPGQRRLPSLVPDQNVLDKRLQECCLGLSPWVCRLGWWWGFTLITSPSARPGS